ncbi:MAG TPA: proteasome-activating nucleotidase [Candidatus Methanoperedenaceae archaeon]|nr:proteasome-activating nucleotidase [Candidatus Methanoperedenaceae archaeon]
MRLLEERNTLLREQNQKIESEKKFVESQKVKYEREVRQLKSELERLKTMPMVVGTVMEVLGDGKLMIRSSTGPQFIVGASQFIKPADLRPGMQVAMNHQTLSVMEVLPSSYDPLTYGMEVIDSLNIAYTDIGGLDAQIKEIRETVELPLIKPELFKRVGVEPPKGVLLYGPPGTGKTLLAKAVSHHTKATFIRIVGSELVQKYIGEGARLVRELFRLAREKAPSIIFIDELDSIGARRLDSAIAGDREVQRTLIQLLAEMDGYNPRENVRIIGATNRPDILDPALLRPGRFDRLVEIPMPNREAREMILRIHTRNMALTGVDMGKVGASTEGLSGADLKAIVTEAGIFAIRSDREAVTELDFENAVKKIRSPRDDPDNRPSGMFA